MSEITKLYENAEVKKQIPAICSSNELYCKGCIAHIEDAIPYCKSAEYPPFYAEKQIEIVKTISTNHISSDYSYKYLGIDRDEIDEEIYLNLCIDDKKYHAHDKDFAVALAKLVNTIWQDLTEEEKQQVKGILE